MLILFTQKAKNCHTEAKMYYQTSRKVWKSRWYQRSWVYQLQLFWSWHLWRRFVIKYAQWCQFEFQELERVKRVHSDAFWSFSFQSAVWDEIFRFSFPLHWFYENLGHYCPLLPYWLIEKRITNSSKDRLLLDTLAKVLKK